MIQENNNLFDKIIKGMKKAADKFIEEKAVNNDMVIISENGIIQEIPAREILEKRRLAKGV